MSFIKFVVLFAVVAQFCFAQTEFTAFCDICRTVDPTSECPDDLSCETTSFTYDGVVGSCSRGHITSLKASNLKLTTLPDSLNAMKYLQMLNIASNGFTSLPVLGGLVALKTLYIYNNKLTTLNGVFPNSTKLEFVSANNNNLTELPIEFADTNMKTLNFDNNNVSSIPANYSKLSKTLVSVSMAGNKLDCAKVSQELPNSRFADKCVQAQQRTEDDVPALPTSYSTEYPREGLDGFEISAIVFFVLFLVCVCLTVLFYVRYRKNGIVA